MELESCKILKFTRYVYSHKWLVKSFLLNKFSGFWVVFGFKWIKIYVIKHT